MEHPLQWVVSMCQMNSLFFHQLHPAFSAGIANCVVSATDTLVMDTQILERVGARVAEEGVVHRYAAFLLTVTEMCYFSSAAWCFAVVIPSVYVLGSANVFLFSPVVNIFGVFDPDMSLTVFT